MSIFCNFVFTCFKRKTNKCNKNQIKWIKYSSHQNRFDAMTIQRRPSNQDDSFGKTLCETMQIDTIISDLRERWQNKNWMHCPSSCFPVFSLFHGGNMFPPFFLSFFVVWSVLALAFLRWNWTWLWLTVKLIAQSDQQMVELNKINKARSLYIDLITHSNLITIYYLSHFSCQGHQFFLQIKTTIVFKLSNDNGYIPNAYFKLQFTICNSITMIDRHNIIKSAFCDKIRVASSQMIIQWIPLLHFRYKKNARPSRNKFSYADIDSMRN